MDDIPEWVEERLLDAADFESDQEPNGDFVVRALNGRQRCRTSWWATTSSLRLGGALASAVLLGFLASRYELAQDQAVDLPIRFPTKVRASTRPDEKQNAPLAEAQQPATEDRTASQARSYGPDLAQSEDSGPQLESVAYHESPPARVRRHHHTHAAPRAIWRTETVERNASGVIEPAWIEKRSGDHGDVTYTPVALDLPLRTQERPLQDSPDDSPSITLTSYTAGGGQ